MTDTEIKIKGYEVLRENLGMVEMEKFIGILQSEKFDYTLWRKELFKNKSVSEISNDAMNSINKDKK